MRKFPKYTDDEHDRLEREAAELIAEAEAALERAQDMFDSFGLDENDVKRISEFMANAEPVEELDKLSLETFGSLSVEEALLKEEKRLLAEMKKETGDSAPRRARKRSRMARV